MTILYHEGQPIQEVRDDWQTKAHGSLWDRYQIYRSCAGDANGIDTLTGKPLKTFEEWVNS